MTFFSNGEPFILIQLTQKYVEILPLLYIRFPNLLESISEFSILCSTIYLSLSMQILYNRFYSKF